MQPFVLAETAWRVVRDATYDVAILPWGATEAHNLHLPYGTDTLETERVAREAARLAWQQGAKVVVLPAIPFGVQTGQLDIPLCINVNPSTQAALLADIVTSLEPHGIRRLVVLNGHGGNDFKAMIRELQPDVDVFLCALNWYAAVDAREYFAEPGDHAGELETSMLLHLAPEHLLPLNQAGDGRVKQFRVTALREGWAWAPRKWTEVSADTGVGNPAAATAEKGRDFFEAVTTKIAGFLVELANADPDEMYE